MYQRDYLMRMIEQAVQFIAQTVFQLKKEGKQEEAQAALGELYQRFALPNRNLIRMVSPDELVALLSQNGQLILEKVTTAALILQEEGNIAEMGSQTETVSFSYGRSLHLWLTAYFANTDESVRTNIETILAQLSSNEIHDQTKILSMGYHVRRGNYAEAENTLYRLSDQMDSATLLDIGVNFYLDLQKKDDSELQTGQLPRNELHDGLVQWRERKL